MRERLVILSGILALSGCTAETAEPGPAPERDPARVQPDGETGIGTFDTLWGVATLDYRWRDGLMIHDGDIALDPASLIDAPSREQASGLGQTSQALLRGTKKWEMVGGIIEVPYSYAADLAPTRQKLIRRAMDEWESEIPFVRFVESSSDLGRRVKFVNWPNSDPHYCLVNGSATDVTKVFCSASCGWITYVHELGHVLGFKHEQKRNDRPTYVEYDKSKTCATSEFTFYDSEKIGTYDIDSIMHYPSCMLANTSNACGGGGTCGPGTPDKWVLKRKPEYGPAYIPWWEARAPGNVIQKGDKCNFKSLYEIACDSVGSGGEGGSDGTAGAAGAGGTSGAGGEAGSASAAGSGGWGVGGDLSKEPGAVAAPEEDTPPTDVANETASSSDDGGCSVSARSNRSERAWMLGWIALGLALFRRIAALPKAARGSNRLR